ncbi:BTAD domain-containing putative transcriptional regulator [Streptomyces daliensis]
METLINEVWADTDTLPAEAPAALQALIGRLRRALGKDAVHSGPGGYRLNAAPDDIDLFRFQRLAREGERALEEGDPAAAVGLLREALGLWRGPAFADLPDRDVPAASAEALRRSARQHRLAAELALGQAAQALPELRELAAENPLDEPQQVLLLRALRDTGRTAEALEAYEAVRKEIAARLGADPGAELRALHAELLDASPVTATPRGPAPQGPPGNLRARLTSFVGREADLDTLRNDLRRSRLVTLTGPGGSGKTRLSEQAAASAVGASDTPYPDGAWLVGLAPLDHPAAVPGAVLSALGRRETSLFGGMEAPRVTGDDLADEATLRLLDHCAHRRLLLVLDNCEHVIDAAAHLAEILLARCPGLTVLATSREPLGVQGEVVRPVEPLPPVSARRLFADRAADARPGLRTSTDSRSAPGGDVEATVEEICRRLDGLPLAIELAAARLRSLTPRQIADRLDDRFRLLTSGSRTVLPRQQTLRAVVDWSWDLLDARERTVLRRLSVFSGGCTLSAAEYVCADPAPASETDGALAEESVPEDAVLGILASLVDKSILIADPPPAPADTGVRYRMLETIHEYAKERAAEHPVDLAATERRHTGRIRRFVAAADARIRSAEQLTWLPRLEADLDNIRAALHRTLHAPDVPEEREAAFGLVRDMGWFWWVRNYREEGAGWVAAALELLRDVRDGDGDGGGGGDGEDEDETYLYREFQLLRYFLLAEYQSQEPPTLPDLLDVARDLLDTFTRPHPRSAAFPGLLWPFAAPLLHGGRDAVEYMDVSVASCRRFGGPWELAVALLFRAHAHVDLPRGLLGMHADIPEIEALAQSTGDRWLLGQVRGLRAEVAVQHGRYEEARAEYATAMRYAQELGALTEMPFLLVRIAEVWYRQGDSEEAGKLSVRAVEEAERLGLTDACIYASFLRSLIALDDGRTDLARRHHREAGRRAAIGTLPTMFDTAMGALEARITAAEGERMDEAVRQARDALALGLSTGTPESQLANALLSAAAVALQAGAPETAVLLADASRDVRGELDPGLPSLRLDGDIRARAGTRTGPRAELPQPGEDAEDAEPAKDGEDTAYATYAAYADQAERTVRRAVTLLDTLLDGDGDGDGVSGS